MGINTMDVRVMETADGDIHLKAGNRCWTVEGVGARNALQDMERASREYFGLPV